MWKFSFEAFSSLCARNLKIWIFLILHHQNEMKRNGNLRKTKKSSARRKNAARFLISKTPGPSPASNAFKVLCNSFLRSTEHICLNALENYFEAFSSRESLNFR
jgi:hypothetical protein